jgi:hypothetical protein
VMTRRKGTFEAVVDRIYMYREALYQPLPRSPEGARKHAERVDRARDALLDAVRDYGTILDGEGR